MLVPGYAPEMELRAQPRGADNEALTSASNNQFNVCFCTCLLRIFSARHALLITMPSFQILVHALHNCELHFLFICCYSMQASP